MQWLCNGDGGFCTFSCIGDGGFCTFSIQKAHPDRCAKSSALRVGYISNMLSLEGGVENREVHDYH